MWSRFQKAFHLETFLGQDVVTWTSPGKYGKRYGSVTFAVWSLHFAWVSALQFKYVLVLLGVMDTFEKSNKYKLLWNRWQLSSWQESQHSLPNGLGWPQSSGFPKHRNPP